MRTHDRETRVSAAVLAGRLAEAAAAVARGEVGGAPGVVGEVAGRGAELAGAAAGAVLTRVLEQSWRRGWLPADLVAVTARRMSGLLLDAIAHEGARYPAAELHPRWRAQVREIGAVVWWQRGRPHLPQWAERAGMPLGEAVGRVVELAAALMALPELPQLLPAPGRPVGAEPVGGVDGRVLARVRALLAKAESTPYAEEAEALSAKAQELMARHAFEQAAVDERPQAAGASRLWITPPYQAPKAQLVDAVAAANRCRAVFYARLGCVVVVGHETDLEIVEVLATSLQVQAARAMAAAESSTRAYRHAFLTAYAHRVRQRLDAANTDATPGDTRLVPVMTERRRAVDAAFAAMFPGVRTRRSSVSDVAGWGAGLAAADRADLLPARPRVAG